MCIDVGVATGGIPDCGARELGREDIWQLAQQTSSSAQLKEPVSSPLRCSRIWSPYAIHIGGACSVGAAGEVGHSRDALGEAL